MKTYRHFLMCGYVTLFLYGCTPCSTSSSGGFANELWGKWKLTKIISPSKSQTSFLYTETLKIGNKTSNGTSTITDSTFKDNTLVGVKEWVGVPGEDCKNSAISVTYTGGMQRKFWLQNKGASLETTAYVNQIGSQTDTIRYFYEAVR